MLAESRIKYWALSWRWNCFSCWKLAKWTNVPYDKLIFSSADKLGGIAENKIELMIEDNPDFFKIFQNWREFPCFVIMQIITNLWKVKMWQGFSTGKIL